MRIHRYPHPILSHKSKTLLKVDEFIKNSIKEMLEYMFDADTTVGLAANQVGLPYTFFVTRIPSCPIVINPTIYRHGGLSERTEGCVSIPDISIKVRRNNKIKLTGYDITGQPIDLKLDGFAARICLHEFDHINGITILNRAKNQINEEVKDKLFEMETEFNSKNFDEELWTSQIKSL